MKIVFKLNQDISEGRFSIIMIFSGILPFLILPQLSYLDTISTMDISRMVIGGLLTLTSCYLAYHILMENKKRTKRIALSPIFFATIILFNTGYYIKGLLTCNLL